MFVENNNSNNTLSHYMLMDELLHSLHYIN